MKRIRRTVAMFISILLVLVNFGVENGLVYASDKRVVAEESENSAEGNKKLAKSEVPSVIEYEKAIKNKHVKRAKDKEKGLDEIVFINEDGSCTMYIYEQNVKFVDKNGEIKDIDLGIEKISNDKKRKGYSYTNGQNEVNIDFPDKIKDGVVVGEETKEIKMYPVDNTQGDLTIEENKAIYINAYGEGTKLVYTPTLSGVKEEIILDYYNNKEAYTFIYDIGDGYITTLDDECLYIYSKNDEYMGLIEPIYMLDAKGKYNTDSQMNYYKNSDGTWTVEVIPDEEFLLDEDTEYPVIIDPTYNVNISTNSTGIQDVTINSTSTSAGKSGSLFVGNRSNTENGISRVLMKIPSVTSNVCSSIEVQSATVTLRDVMCESTAMTIECRQFTGSSAWTEDNVSWTNYGGSSYGELYSSKTISYANGLNMGHTYNFDVTVAVKEWINSSVKRSQGLVFKATYENVVQNKTFASYQRGSYQPTFTMTYVENKAAFNWEKDLRFLKGREEHYQTPPNCAGYALGIAEWIDALTENFEPNFNSIGNFAYSFKSYVDSYVADRKIVYIYSGDYRKIRLSYNQYLIAARISAGDFHFMVQTDDGKWTQKAGNEAAEQPTYYNPKTEKWNSKYTSDTIYMIVERSDI